LPSITKTFVVAFVKIELITVKVLHVFELVFITNPMHPDVTLQFAMQSFTLTFDRVFSKSFPPAILLVAEENVCGPIPIIPFTNAGQYHPDGLDVFGEK
jgi:hypothetical protein